MPKPGAGTPPPPVPGAGPFGSGTTGEGPPPGPAAGPAAGPRLPPGPPPRAPPAPPTGGPGGAEPPRGSPIPAGPGTAAEPLPGGTGTFAPTETPGCGPDAPPPPDVAPPGDDPAGGRGGGLGGEAVVDGRGLGLVLLERAVRDLVVDLVVLGDGDVVRAAALEGLPGLADVVARALDPGELGRVHEPDLTAHALERAAVVEHAVGAVLGDGRGAVDAGRGAVQGFLGRPGGGALPRDAEVGHAAVECLLGRRHVVDEGTQAVRRLPGRLGARFTEDPCRLRGDVEGFVVVAAGEGHGRIPNARAAGRRTAERRSSGSPCSRPRSGRTPGQRSSAGHARLPPRASSPGALP